MTIDLTKLMALDPTITLAQFAALIASSESSLGISVTARGYGAPPEPMTEPVTAPRPVPVEVVPAVTAKPVETKPAASNGAFDCKKCGVPTTPSESGGRARPGWCGPCAAESFRQCGAKSQAAQAAKRAAKQAEAEAQPVERAEPEPIAAPASEPEALPVDNTLNRAEFKARRNRAGMVSLEALSYRSGVSVAALDALQTIGERLHPDDEKRVLAALDWAEAATGMQRLDMDMAYRRDLLKPNGLALVTAGTKLG